MMLTTSLRTVSCVLLQGPFDGVLGFSQGASMVSLLCAMQAQQAPGEEPGSLLYLQYAMVVLGSDSL